MAQPSWVTDPGNLGTIPENRFYRISLEAFDPDFPTDLTKVKFIKLSGDLPLGIQVSPAGILEGTPSASLQGVPNLVSQNIISKFAVRAFTEKEVNGAIIPDRINDRTFTITVTGQDIPEFITPAGSLGIFFDGQAVDEQIEFSDEDPDDVVVISLISGELPPGLSISADGLISGHIAPVGSVNAESLFEAVGWEEFEFEFDPGTISKTYEFTLKITDGLDSNLRTFSMFVGTITADSEAFTADFCATADTDACVGATTSLSITADSISRAPFLDPYTPDLGIFLHDNYFAYEFNGVDFDNDTLNYGLINSDTSLITADAEITVDFTSSLPPSLVLDIETGFLYGNLNNVGLTEQTFSFTILVYKKDNPIIFSAFDFTITVIGDINSGVTWVTDECLGNIDNGAISEFLVQATATSGVDLQYRIVEGSCSRLPQGLLLVQSGNIIGRVSYQTFGIIDFPFTADSGSTFADTTVVTTDAQGGTTITFDNGTTTFDSIFTFTVEAFSLDGQVSTFRTFKIIVDRRFNTPSHELRLDALPPQNDRELLDTLLQNQDTIKEELLYRSDDPYFGVATNVFYVHAYNLNPETCLSYVESLEFNHYDRNLTLGEIRTAIALDDNGEIQYEVVYSTVLGYLINNDRVSVSRSVESAAGTVFPGSLPNMRNRVVDKVGQISNDLPRWMTSVQPDGNILGFTHAWVIAYTLPGQSALVQYTIDQNFGVQLNKVDFTIDRYTLGSQFAKNWDAFNQRWLPTSATTFDLFLHVLLTADFCAEADIDACVGATTSLSITADTTIATPIRFLTVDVVTPDVDAETADSTTLTADTTVAAFTPLTVDLTDIIDLDSPGTETIFDGGCTRLIGVRSKTTDITIDTADCIDITADGGLFDTNTTFEVTDRFDKYLLFPNVDIINKKQVVTTIN